MTLRPRIHDLYVAKAVLLSLAAAWGVLLGFDLIIAFADALNSVGEGGYTAGHAVLYTLNTLPRRAYTLFPTAAVIGCLLGLGGLAATSELTALRAAGLSRLRICVGAALALGVVTAGMVVVGETAGPEGDQRAQALATAAKSRDMILARFSGLWAREGDVFLNARTGVQRGRSGEGWVELEDVRLYEFSPDGRLVSLAQARIAEHRAGEWTLRDVRRTRFGEREATLEARAEERWASSLDAGTLAASMVRPRYLTTAQLGATIEHMRRSGIDPGPYLVAYWERWFYPVKALALCLAAMPFAFGQLRSGGFGKRLFAGIVFGLSFFLLERLAVNLASVYRIDLRLAYLLPPLLVLATSWLLFHRRV